MRRTLLALALVFAFAPAVRAATYVVSPKASDATKSAVADGRPPEHGFPAIDDVRWTTLDVRPGTTLEADVTTSTNIDHVEGRYRDWDLAFTQLGLGRFHLTYKVPWLPPFLIGHWKIDVIARSIDGVEAKRSFDFRYRYF
jgi:hypothetical protein